MDIDTNINIDKDIITFIIPSIGKESLKYSIESLTNQTSQNWKAIIVFDGCKNKCTSNVCKSKK